MADFVAVIRRTVDGLSENVPDMRAKVYDKARSAVRRQLENMTPRPSDEMIGRQMAKLEQAIALVEGENAEALPPLDADIAGADDVAAASESHAAPEHTETPVPDHPAQPEQGPVAAEAGVAETAGEPVRDEPAASAEIAEPAPSNEAADAVPSHGEPAAPVDAWAAEATAPWPQEEPAEHAAGEPLTESGDVGEEPLSDQSEAAEVVEAAPLESDVDTTEPEPEDLHEPAVEPQPAAPTAEEPPAEPVAAWSEERDDVVEAPVASPVSQDDVLAAWPPQTEADDAAATAQQGEEPAIEPVPEREEAAWAVEPARDEEPVTDGGGPAAFAIDARTAEADLDAFFSSVSAPDNRVSPTPEAARDAVLAADHDEPVAVEASVSAPYESEHIHDVHSHDRDEPFAAAGPAEAAAEAAPLGFWPDRAEIEPVAVPAPEPQATPWDAVPAWTVTPPADAHGEVPVETHPLDTGTRYDLSGNPHDLLAPVPRAPTLAEDAVALDPVALDPVARDPMADWSWPDDKPEQRVAAEQDAPASTARGHDADNWAARELDQILAEDARGHAPADAAVAGAGIALGGMANAGGVGVGGAGYGGAPSSAYADPDALPERDPVIPAGKPLSYRVQPKRRMSPLLSVLVVALLALGGGGYAYYTNQQTVNDWAKALVASVTSNGGTAQTAPPSDTPANGTATAPASRELSASGSGEPGAGSVPPTASGQTEVAAIDPGPQKFTQRLQADGTEVDAGPAVLASADPTVSEGKSVAEKTDSAPGLAASASDATTGTPPAAATQTTTTPAQTTPAAGEAASALPGEKMFLYEERLGQTSPTAIPGTAVWSVKEESPGGDAKPEPVIQAQITVPDRGLTALMTIKRNADSSLPASHVIEFVFSVPDTFEGGSIDAVQRVAMKRTEQDRGDALIAVPAKITDDFYMIALNDFPEAVTANLQLLESRSWIDIPITYRNGRRALLTLEKGQTGRQAFSTALQAWAKLPSAAPANGQ